MRRLALLVLLPAVLVPAACGTSAPSYSLDRTRACIEDSGMAVTKPAGDFVAQSATVGAFRAYLEGRRGNFVTASFGENADEAADTVLGYERFHGENVGLSDILFSDRNVVMLWKEHPSDEEAARVTGCLS